MNHISCVNALNSRNTSYSLYGRLKTIILTMTFDISQSYETSRVNELKNDQ